MKYKTTIEIVAEAEDRDEAMEIAGEYLSGNLISGVDMRCRTKPVQSFKKVGVVLSIAIFVLVTIGIVSSINTHGSKISLSNISGASAIQPPLKTSILNKKDAEFKKEWENKQAKEILDYIKK